MLKCYDMKIIPHRKHLNLHLMKYDKKTNIKDTLSLMIQLLWF